MSVLVPSGGQGVLTCALVVAEPRQRELGAVRHGVRRGGRRLPRAPRAPRAPCALAHRALARQVRPARQLQRQGRGMKL